MSKIKFFALGGLGEHGKNMFVCEVDERIFILDAGLKYPSVDLYGIDTIIPDLQYLKNNKEKIQGIFISHGHENNIGAVAELLKQFDVGVFGTHFTISVIEDYLINEGMDLKNHRLYRINEDKKLKFGNITIEFYNVSHSIPETVNIAICTEDGAIIYAPDFCFDTNRDKKYQTSFSRINDIAKKGVIALASESLGTSNTLRAANNAMLDHYIVQALQTNKRVIFSLYSTALDKIQKVIDLSVENNRKIAIIGIKTQRIVNIAIKNNYLDVPEGKLVNLRFIDEHNKNHDKDLVVIVAGNRHEPFYMLQRMCKKQDRLIEIDENDLVVMASPPVPGTERIATRTIDALLKNKATVVEIKKSMLKSSHANVEDLKILYSMLNPKYIIPIIGEYRHQYQQKNIILDYGYPEEKIIMLDNGDVCEFDNGVFQGVKSKVPVGDVLVDGSIVGDINEVVLKDRELLSQDGLVLIAMTIDTSKKDILAGPEIICKGFVMPETIENFLEDLKDMLAETIYSYMYKKYIDWSEAKLRIRDKVTKEINKEIKKNPIVTISIVDINNKL